MKNIATTSASNSTMATGVAAIHKSRELMRWKVFLIIGEGKGRGPRYEGRVNCDRSYRFQELAQIFALLCEFGMPVRVEKLLCIYSARVPRPAALRF